MAQLVMLLMNAYQLHIAGPGGNCTADEQCLPGYGCNNNICTQIFTLDVGQSATDPKFCNSNFTVDGLCDILTVQIEGSSYTLYTPFICQQYDYCVYTLSNGTIYDITECGCAGYNNLPEGFCGDYLPYVSSVMDVVNQALVYTSSNCAGSRAHSSNPMILSYCKSISSAQFTYYHNIYNQAIY